MIKSKTILEVKTGERVYEFTCPPDTPLGEAHDALCQMKAYVIERITEQQKKETAPPPEVTVEDAK
jgi:hypothetical protein